MVSSGLVITKNRKSKKRMWVRRIGIGFGFGIIAVAWVLSATYLYLKDLGELLSSVSGPR